MADPAATSAPVTGLVATVEYTVVVVAQYSDGGHAASAPASGTPSALSSAPGQPQGLTVALDPAGRAQASFRPTDPVAALVSWDAPPHSEGVLFSEIQWRRGGGSYGTADRAAAGASPASVAVSRLGRTYDTRLRHWNADGPGPWTEEAGWLAAFEPDPPLNARLIPSDGTPGCRLVRPAVQRWQSGHRVPHRAPRGLVGPLEHRPGRRAGAPDLAGRAGQRHPLRGAAERPQRGRHPAWPPQPSRARPRCCPLSPWTWR